MLDPEIVGQNNWYFIQGSGWTITLGIETCKQYPCLVAQMEAVFEDVLHHTGAPGFKQVHQETNRCTRKQTYTQCICVSFQGIPCPENCCVSHWKTEVPELISCCHTCREEKRMIAMMGGESPKAFSFTFAFHIPPLMLRIHNSTHQPHLPQCWSTTKLAAMQAFYVQFDSRSIGK